MISKHISEKEATKSVTALRLNIDNTPNGTAINNMRILAEQVFEPLRKWVGGPINIAVLIYVLRWDQKAVVSTQKVKQWI